MKKKSMVVLMLLMTASFGVYAQTSQYLYWRCVGLLKL